MTDKYVESIVFKPNTSTLRIAIIEGELRIHFKENDSYYPLEIWEAKALLSVLEPAIKKLEHFLKPKF